MDRKKAIAISLLVTIVLGGLFIFYTQKQLSAQTKTVPVFMAAKFIPMGTEVKKEDVITVELQLPENILETMVTEKEGPYFKDKITVQNIVSGQIISKNSVVNGLPLRQGYVVVYIPTDLSKSAMAIPGDLVHLYPVASGYEGVTFDAIYENARVIRSLDQKGNDIDPGRGEMLKKLATDGSKVPVSIGVEIPKERAKDIVNFAASKKVYLVKAHQGGE